MTTPEHIEEAQKLADYPDRIDAIATALAAAEERGRLAERERCKKIADYEADVWNCGECSSAQLISKRIQSPVITKEPTP